MKSNLEKMLKHLTNEDREGAEQIFHEYIVQRSRKIYESLLEDDLDNDPEELGGDPTDDFEMDIDDEGEGELGDEDLGDDEFGDEEMGDDEFGDEDPEELEDRVVDLEDALDDLKAEFERLMSDESDEEGEEFGDEEMGDDEFGDEESGDEEMGVEEFGDEESNEEFGDDDPDELKDSIQTMREYVEKVSNPKPGDNGANATSVVAGANKLSNSGTTDNIVRDDTATEKPTKTSPKVDDAGNRNKPGAKAGKLNSVSKPTMGPKDSEKSMLGKGKRK